MKPPLAHDHPMMNGIAHVMGQLSPDAQSRVLSHFYDAASRELASPAVDDDWKGADSLCPAQVAILQTLAE